MIRAALIVMRRAHRMKRAAGASTVAPGGEPRAWARCSRGLDAGGRRRGCVSTPVPRSASTSVWRNVLELEVQAPEIDGDARIARGRRVGDGRLGAVAGAQRLQPSLERRRPARLPQLHEDGVDPVRHLLGALPALRGVGAQGAVDQPLDVGIQIAHDLRGLLGPRAPDRHQDVRVRLPVEGLPPGDEEVEHGAHREQIRAPVERPGLRLLGRHVRELPLDDAGRRLLASGRPPSRCRSPPASPRPAG